MGKYFIKPEFIDCEIHTRTSDGTEILVNNKIFNDYFGELMINNGLSHIVGVNEHYTPSEDEKKSYVKISEDVIGLISPYEQIGETSLNETQNEQKLNLLDGKPQLKRKSKKNQD